MKTGIFYSFICFVLFHFNGSAQDQKAASSDNIVMTWNKNTPESEMNDDIKALKEHGVTISYSDIKRNSKGEITAIKVAYTDKGGSKGNMALDNQKPINTIKFYKQDDEMGFGEPSGSNFVSGNNFAYGFNPNDMMKSFQFNGNEDGLPGQQFHFDFPNGKSFGQSSSKVIIQKDGKKPLVIENGNVVEGGDDYTKEELEEIKKDNKVESFSGPDMQSFGANGFGDLQKQMKQMQDQIDQMMEQQSLTKPGKPAKPGKHESDIDRTTDEMKKTTEELKKAKTEMENAAKELKNAKSSLKTQKT